MSIGKTGKILFSSSLITAVMFAPAWSESVSAYAPGDEDSSGQNVEENTGDSQNYLLRNDQGSEVEQLQSDLSTQGYTLQVDGIFGPETENAVEAFQSDQGLGIDGVVGPNTYDALSSDNSGSGDASASEGSDNGESQTQDSSSDSGIVATAESVLGTPYVWGGTTPDGFDSSGFINYVYDQNGIDVSRTHEAMWNNDGEHVTSPSIGDLVFFEGTYETSGASHSGIYIGDDQMIHAGSDGIVEADISSDYWQNHFLGVKSMQ
ncbi:NlpC/P60 family protein [Natribacillus halophilus]|uniref:Putative peptidoglycan binding domain-containing protein n=1 Tax=Natribacillus halophilus TaxID=549003 RepID=A0A1G8LMR9_9BACI|nr:NlpC/P60 family protein [Natribacillus halophilus]SDI56988.1 Putative peptidoglycan binding domain-containing protein [Natribacillus halophilus]